MLCSYESDELHFCFYCTIYSTQIMYICLFSMYSLGNTFLKDPLVMQGKADENQKPFSTSSIQLCPRCLFCFEGPVKIGNGHSADKEPWTLTTFFLTLNLFTSFANLVILVNSSNNLTDKCWKSSKTPE